MAEYEDGQIEFAILSLVKDPLVSLLPKLASNVKSIQSLSARLERVEPDWRQVTTRTISEEMLVPDNALTGPDNTYGLTQENIDTSQLSEFITQDRPSNAADILVFRQKLVTSQAELRMSIMSEFESNRLDEEKAASRRHDYGPVIQKWILCHARQSAIEKVLESCMAV